MMRPRIFLADDHSLLLEAFSNLLEPKYEVVGTATDGRQMLPDVKLVFLTVNEDPDMVTEAFRIGANGYLLKSSASTELFQAIDAVLNSKNYVTPKITQGMISAFIKNPGGQKIHGNLTIRQREVLQLLAEGNTMKQVATTLNITPRTVAFHKYQIMEDLNIKTNSELIQYAIKHGFVS
jgi:DNA-binding NarL/FixJ family response regulator